MAEEWRDLALTVPGTLMLVGTSEEALRLTDLADRKFAVRANVMRRLRYGTRPGDIDDSDDPAPVGVCPTVILEDARREISHRSALHAKSGHVFLRYGAHVGLHRDDPLYQSMIEHHAAALRLADQALEKVRSAASSAAAAQDAVAIAEGLPSWFPIWSDWMMAAEQLLNGASNEAFVATHLVHRMHHTVVLLEFFDAWMILNR